MIGNSNDETGGFIRGVAFAVMLLGAVAACFADVPPEQRAEVAHLLSFVRYSDCEMIRNGTTHNGVEGYRHMLDKYDYFRDRIHSTEDFIDLAASKSLLSGKRYQVDCPAHKPQNASVWLRDELSRYRACMERGADCGRTEDRVHSRR